MASKVMMCQRSASNTLRSAKASYKLHDMCSVTYCEDSEHA